MAWVAAGTLGRAVLQIAVMAGLARMVTPAEFGVVSAAQLVVSFLSILSQIGVGPALVQRGQLSDAHIRTAFTFSMLLGTVLAGAVVASVDSIGHLLRIDGLAGVLRALSLVLLIGSTSVVAESLLQRELQFKTISRITIGSYAAGYAVVGLGSAFMGAGVWALVYASVTQTAVLASSALMLKSHAMMPLFEWKSFRELIYFGGGFTVAKVFNQFALQGDNFVVGRWLGAEALGVYGRAYQLMAMPASLFGQMLDSVLFPTLAKVQQDRQRLAAAYRRSVSLGWTVMFPFSVCFAILAPELVTLALGSGWSAVIAPLKLFAVGAALRTGYRASDALARATGAVYVRAWRQGLYAVAVVGGAYLGKSHGIVGVSISVLIALTINYLAMAHLSLRITGLSWIELLKAKVPGTALGAVVLFVTIGVKSLLNQYAMTGVGVLLVSAMASIAGVLLACRYLPRSFIGEDSAWLIRLVKETIQDRMTSNVRTGAHAGR